MRCAPALLKVSRVQLAPSSERPAATQSELPSVGATKPSSETDIFRTSEAMRCFLPGMDDVAQLGARAYASDAHRRSDGGLDERLRHRSCDGVDRPPARAVRG